MFGTLPESQRQRDASPLSAAASTIAHVALGVVALAATAGAHVPTARLAHERVHYVAYRAARPKPDPSPPAARAKRPRPAAHRRRVKPVPMNRLIPPTTIPTGITVDVNVTPPDPEFAEYIPNAADFALAGDTAGGGATPHAQADGTYLATELDLTIVPAPDNPRPYYPEQMQDDGISGEVLAEFVVDTTGRIEPSSFRIVRSTQPSFTESVRAIVPALRFRPARVAGRKVRVRVDYPVQFVLPH